MAGVGFLVWRPEVFEPSEVAANDRLHLSGIVIQATFHRIDEIGADDVPFRAGFFPVGFVPVLDATLAFVDAGASFFAETPNELFCIRPVSLDRTRRTLLCLSFFVFLSRVPLFDRCFDEVASARQVLLENAAMTLKSCKFVKIAAVQDALDLLQFEAEFAKEKDLLQSEQILFFHSNGIHWPRSTRV